MDKIIGKFLSKEYGIDVEVYKVNKIPGGIEVFARGWKNGKQLGFGVDGTVDLERFRFFNPRTLVDDPNGKVVRKWEDKVTGKTITRRLRSDLVEATRQSLVHTMSLVGKENTNIISGKLGNTTSTFYPDAGKPGTSSVDGNPEHRGAAAYATAHDAANATDLDSNGTGVLYHYVTYAGAWFINRIMVFFDTSAIPDGDIIDSAVLSLKPSNINSTADSTTITGMSNTSANNNYAVGDYSKFDSTKFATDVAWTAFTLNAYYDFALNASGISAISKTGTTKFGVRAKTDYDNNSTQADKSLAFYSADTAGTTSDPKLVVVHTTPPPKIPLKVYQAIHRSNFY